MKKVLIFCFGLFTVLIFSAAIIKEDPFALFLKRLEEFSKKYPTEKIHLHLDKPYYAIGDDIWFKAYLTDSRTSGPSTISNILYVELIDENDSLKSQLKLPIANGITWGDFKLSDTLTEGNYRIRAYTQWMRNAGTDFFFDKTIKIGNSWANKVFVKADHLVSQEGTNERINTTIRFVDSDSKPYISALVNYVVELGPNEIKRGKATTDSKGEINVLISNNKPEINRSGKIIATIVLSDKQTNTKVIPIKTTSAYNRCTILARRRKSSARPPKQNSG